MSGLGEVMTFSGIEQVNLDGGAGYGGNTLTVTGTTGADAFGYTPTGAAAGQLQISGSATAYSFANIDGTFLANLAGGGDTVTIHGTSGDDTVTSTGGNTVTVQVNSLKSIALAASGISAMSLDGDTGNDTLVVDSSASPITIPVTCIGGGGTDTVTLQGGSATSDVFTAGPGTRQGSSILVFANGSENITATGISSILDLVSGTLTANGTSANNAINYTQGASSANGRVAIDACTAIEFSNKTSLSIVGGAGTDTITLNNPTTPTGLTNIYVNGAAQAPTLPVLGAVLWLDASTLSLADGAVVSQLNDLSGNNNNAVPADAANKPTFNAGVLGGRGTIHFNGGTQGLITQQNIGISGGDSRSVFVVMRRDSGTMVVQMGESDLYKAYAISSQPNHLCVPYVIGMGGVETTSPRPDGTYEIYDALHQHGVPGVNDGTNYGYINGAFVGSSSNTPDATLTNRPLQIGYLAAEHGGSATSSSGDLAEIIVYNRYLSDTERQAVEAYLTTKWLTVNHAPTLDSIANPAAIIENAGAQTVALSGISDGDGETQSIQFTVSSDNTTLIPSPTVTSTRPTGTVSYTPAANQYGSAHLTVTVRDSGFDGIFGTSDDLATTRTFTVVVNSPSTLPSGMVVWLDASTLKNLTNGAPVPQLADLSSNHNNAVAIDSANMPTFVAGGLNTMGTIHFAGGTQGLTTQSNLGLSGSASRQIFVVMQKNDPTNGRMCVVTGTTPSGFAAFGIDSHTTGEIYVPFTSGVGGVVVPARANATYELYDISHNSATDENKGYINGTLVGTGFAGVATPDSPLRIGYWSQVPASCYGDLAEIIVYNRVLSDGERAVVEAYLNSKWFGAVGGSSAASADAPLVQNEAGAGGDSDILIVTGRTGANDAILVTSTGDNAGTVDYIATSLPSVTFSAVKALTMVGQTADSDVFNVGGVNLGRGQDMLTVRGAKLQASTGHTLSATVDVTVCRKRHARSRRNHDHGPQRDSRKRQHRCWNACRQFLHSGEWRRQCFSSGQHRYNEERRRYGDPIGHEHLHRQHGCRIRSVGDRQLAIATGNLQPNRRKRRDGRIQQQFDEGRAGQTPHACCRQHRTGRDRQRFGRTGTRDVCHPDCTGCRRAAPAVDCRSPDVHRSNQWNACGRGIACQECDGARAIR